MMRLLSSWRRALPRSPGDTVIYLLLLGGVGLFLLPVYVMVVTGLKDAQSVSLATMWELPGHLGPGGFAEASGRLLPNLLNSFELAIPATVLSAFLGAVNGYLFSKWPFPGSGLLFGLLLFGMFIPYQSILIPMVQFLQRVGLYGKLSGLITAHVIYALPVVTLIFRNYFANIPDEMIEAARIDGAGVVNTFRHVVLPLAVPAFVVVGIFQFTNIWNDFLFGMTLVPNPRVQPVTVALNNLSGSYSVDWNVVMAGSVLVALPTALVYVLLGRFFVRGLLAGSVKG